jgi:integrase
MAKWDARQQKFIGMDEGCLRNNKLLADFILPYKEVLEAADINTPVELFQRYDAIQAIIDEEDRKTKAKALTLGEYVEVCIEEYKNPSSRHPSANYVPYLTLLHKLQKEGNIINTKVYNLSRQTQAEWVKWILSSNNKGKGNNFNSLNKMLQAIINKAYKSGLSEYKANYPWRDYAPVINPGEQKAYKLIKRGTEGQVKSLSSEQYQTFVNMDLRDVSWRVNHISYYNELYRDYCILLYELKSRPMDVLKLKWENFTFDHENNCIILTYIPAKKKNYDILKTQSNALVMTPVSKKAWEIMKKYEGQSKGGYVLPFSMNDTEWDLDNPEVYQKYYKAANHTEGRINRFLKKVGFKLRLDFDLTIYAFRRTAITAQLAKGTDAAVVAEMAGTSIEMIDRHYKNKRDMIKRQLAAIAAVG